VPRDAGHRGQRVLSRLSGRDVNMLSDFPRHHRSTSPDRAEVLMVVLVTIASVLVRGWIAVWLLSAVGAAWLGAVAALSSTPA
jgi:hypothetical protein